VALDKPVSYKTDWWYVRFFCFLVAIIIRPKNQGVIWATDLSLTKIYYVEHSWRAKWVSVVNHSACWFNSM